MVSLTRRNPDREKEENLQIPHNLDFTGLAKEPSQGGPKILQPGSRGPRPEAGPHMPITVFCPSVMLSR